MERKGLELRSTRNYAFVTSSFLTCLCVCLETETGCVSLYLA